MVNADSAKSIFLAAIEMPPMERADFLAEAAGRTAQDVCRQLIDGGTWMA